MRKWVFVVLPFAITVGCGSFSGQAGGSEQRTNDGADADVPEGGGSSDSRGMIEPSTDGGDSLDASAHLGDADADASIDAGPFGGPANLGVFVTSATFETFDPATVCNAPAQKLGGTWVAWVGYQNYTALTQVGAGPWYRHDGKLVATLGNLEVKRVLEAPIQFDENGNDLMSASVYTGLDETGVSTGNDCGHWTGGSGNATIGVANASDKNWTNDGFVSCNGVADHVYCFEVSH